MRTNSLLMQARLDRGWTRPQVEAMSEYQITIPSLTRWELGYCYPQEDNRLRLAQLYEMSLEQLALDQNHAIMGSEQSTPIIEEAPMSDLVRRTMFGSLSSKLSSLIDTWPRRDYCYEELQGEINRVVIDYNAVVALDHSYEQTRRDALINMILVPLELIGGLSVIDAGKMQKTDTRILLKHVASGIAGCWYLRRGKDHLIFVNDLISAYLSLLQPLISSQSEAHRKASANLLSQCFMLKSHLGSESNVAFIEQALRYALLSEDPAIQALAYRRRAYENWDIRKYKDALRDAEKGYGLARSSRDIPKIIHSDTASTLALCQAACKQTNDARVSLTESRNLFDPVMVLPFMSYTESILASMSGSVYQHIGQWGEAITLHEQSLNFPDIGALGYAERRINYAEAEVSRDDKSRDMGLCIKLLTEAITRAEELGSQGYIEKASEVYDLLRIVWPREEAVKKLGREHFGVKK